ncbi:PH domain-containing protein [Streptomyces filamentosus]|uniref:Low molecular weight protein antigen 6 PH domain-containing protein n=1 Tax=Streptomyces filamentosus TaxID=67294 RepID=A0A919BIP6_STRFL|nr:PH domain-containing protein [Streptomyces filamentosus]GHF89985.1 hypothetical protein GCM10017667_18720 [Streptomyces filamentosus]
MISVLGLGTALVGLAGMGTGDRFLSGILLAAGGWVVLTAPFAGVRVDGRGLRYRGVARRDFLPWSEVASVETGSLGGRLWNANVPVVTTRGGTEMTLLMLAGYEGWGGRPNARVREQAGTMTRRAALAREDARAAGATTAGLTLHRLVTRDQWNRYAAREAVYARADTPRGEVTLTRGPGVGRDPEEIANGAERWTLDLRGETRMVLFRICAGGYGSRWSLGRGVDGEFDGVPFRYSGRSALRPSRRAVVLEGDGIDVRFVHRGFGQVLVEGGERAALYGGLRGWDLTDASDPAVLAACVHEWAGAGHFLRTPVFREL